MKNYISNFPNANYLISKHLYIYIYRFHTLYTSVVGCATCLYLLHLLYLFTPVSKANIHFIFTPRGIYTIIIERPFKACERIQRDGIPLGNQYSSRFNFYINFSIFLFLFNILIHFSFHFFLLFLKDWKKI